MDLIVVSRDGLYCPPGRFHIDPWRPVDRAVITHAHGDHARVGSNHYLASSASAEVLRVRLGDVSLDTLPYGARLAQGDVTVSLHPAGHVLGAAQVRIEHRGEVWVVSGDYKLEHDATCAPFEPVRCHTFVTESTFGLPIYRWGNPRDTIAHIASWWRDNATNQRTSVLYCYAFGKAQRVLAGLQDEEALDIGPLACHGAMVSLNAAYRAAGVPIPDVPRAADIPKTSLQCALVLAPPSASGTPWLRRFGDFSDGFASGWMHVRGARRRRGVDRGFVLSDHADWPALNAAIAATEARRIVVTHGQIATMVRWLSERGLQAEAFETEFADEGEPELAPEPGTY
ncbi:MAG TPA: ligase-associated DNA damage response exonuclease [Casimicrobiaceae bacterium]|nr:ligase-associated DNA damage response exonuclease [Casimicrobiaceae bacterium]